MLFAFEPALRWTHEFTDPFLCLFLCHVPQSILHGHLDKILVEQSSSPQQTGASWPRSDLISSCIIMRNSLLLCPVLASSASLSNSSCIVDIVYGALSGDRTHASGVLEAPAFPLGYQRTRPYSPIVSKAALTAALTAASSCS
jgi:hypothetical protein